MTLVSSTFPVPSASLMPWPCVTCSRQGQGRWPSVSMPQRNSLPLKVPCAHPGLITVSRRCAPMPGNAWVICLSLINHLTTLGYVPIFLERDERPMTDRPVGPHDRNYVPHRIVFWADSDDMTTTNTWVFWFQEFTRTIILDAATSV